MENDQEKLNRGEFLQSEEWRKFQESVGRKTYSIAGDGFRASVIEHRLPVVGKYFYIPRGPVAENQKSKINLPAGEAGNQNCNSKFKSLMRNLIDLAKENKIGWIRLDPSSPELLEEIKKNIDLKIAKAPHDMQPREIFVIDIVKPEEELLAGMKSKTRYNIRLAEKRGVNAVESSKYKVLSKKEIVDEFIRLTKVMARRQGITAHPEGYYRKMLEVIPGDILRLYVAEYQGKVIAANLVVFYGKTCIYLHGASDDELRNVMAPYMLQWRQIQDARAAGCEKYDFGGIKSITNDQGSMINKKSWSGISRFKLGFSPQTAPTRFLGSYDVVIDPMRYNLYRIIQKLKSFL